MLGDDKSRDVISFCLNDIELDTIALPVNEGRNNLWNKTKSAFQNVYKNVRAEKDKTFLIKSELIKLFTKFQRT